MLAWAPAWPAEPVDVAQPATRRARARRPPVLVVCNRVMRGGLIVLVRSPERGSTYSVIDQTQAWSGLAGACFS